MSGVRHTRVFDPVDDKWTWKSFMEGFSIKSMPLLKKYLYLLFVCFFQIIAAIAGTIAFAVIYLAITWVGRAEPLGSHWATLGGIDLGVWGLADPIGGLAGAAIGIALFIASGFWFRDVIRAKFGLPESQVKSLNALDITCQIIGIIVLIGGIASIARAWWIVRDDFNMMAGSKTGMRWFELLAELRMLFGLPPFPH